MGSLPPPKIQRIAIIGAGPAGVVAAKYLLAENYFTKIDVYEQRASFGGVWNYSPDRQPRTLDIPSTNPHQPPEEPTWRPTNPLQNGLKNNTEQKTPTFPTPMYENLESNIPHTIMKHPDKPLEENQLFPSRETILNYLQEYAAPITHLVHFHTQITSISLTHNHPQPTWHLTSLSLSPSLRTSTPSTTPYDALIIATGHHTLPTIPSIPGLQAWNTRNPGTTTHSKNYRDPSPYVEKKVLVIGNAASGTDIARQIASVCAQPLLLSSRSENELFFSEGGEMKMVGEVVEFLARDQGKGYGGRAVRFEDGRVEGGIDAVVFATGYYYSFPFVESLLPPLITTGERVEGTFRHVFWRYEMSLAFVGLPTKIIPFRTFEGQAAVIARVWSGRLDLPSEGEMREWEEGVVRERGVGKGFHVLAFPRDFEYLNEMVAWAEEARDMDGGGKGKLPPKWNAKETWTRERFPAIKRAFAERGEGRYAVRTVEELGFDYEGWVREHKNGEGKEGKRFIREYHNS